MIRDFFRKEFFTKQSTGMKIARKSVIASISLIIICFGINFHFDRDVERFKESTKQRRRERAEIKAEAKRRNSVKEKTETGSIADARLSQPPVDHRNPTTANTPETPSTETRDRVEVMTSGPLKGMEVEVAKALANQNLADAKAAARKRHEWELKRKEIRQRQSKNEDQILNLVRAKTERGDDELGLILSTFQLMPEEQREQARQKLLQTEPADKVNAFFDNVANAPTKTPDQLQRDAQDILKTREAYSTARRELEIEYEQLKLELEEHDSTRPF